MNVRLITCPDKAHIVKGSMKQFWAPLLLRELSKETIIKAIQWSEDIQHLDESLADCTYLIFEILSSVSGPNQTYQYQIHFETQLTPMSPSSVTRQDQYRAVPGQGPRAENIFSSSAPDALQAMGQIKRNLLEIWPLRQRPRFWGQMQRYITCQMVLRTFMILKR